MRVFIGIELEESIKRALVSYQTRCQKALPAARVRAIRWPKQEQLHITLAFLGEIKSEQLQPLRSAVIQCAKDLAPGSFLLSQVGFFPEKGTSRVFWAGLSDQNQLLNGCYAAVVEGLEHLGMPIEKHPFVPHITLARIKSGKDGALLRGAVDDLELPEGEQQVKKISIFESVLEQSGAKYIVLEEIALG